MENGILLIDKPTGLTSRNVDNAIGRMFHTHRVGHLGTLDPFASGLLVVALNQGTKFLPFLPSSPKTYLASLRLGEKTSTGDTDGEIVERSIVPSLDDTTIEKTLSSFLGESYQTPPMTSAIKINGVALYKYAHKGEEKKREKRLIHVSKIEAVSFDGTNLVFVVSVSSGTYIRVLGEDIALKLGTVGHLTSLRRLSIGNISVNDAKDFISIKEKDVEDPTPFICDMPHFEIAPSLEKAIKDGKKITLPSDFGPRVLLTIQKKAVAVYQKENGFLYRSERGLFYE